jgi:site-specific recombinase XerD
LAAKVYNPQLKQLRPSSIFSKISGYSGGPSTNAIVGKTINWHSFRHSLATKLAVHGVDVKVAQELLRHPNSRITLDLYTRAVSSEKRAASGKKFDLLMGGSVSVPSSAPLSA